MFKPGDVAFFKEARKGVKKSSPGAKCPGHFFGVVLGIVPPFQKEPQPDQLLRLMGSAGFVSFDDVALLLGDKVGAKLVAAFEMRYYGRTAAPQVLTRWQKIRFWLMSWRKPVPKGALPPASEAAVNEEGPEEGHPPTSLLGGEQRPTTGLVDPRGRPI